VSLDGLKVARGAQPAALSNNELKNEKSPVEPASFSLQGPRPQPAGFSRPKAAPFGRGHAPPEARSLKAPQATFSP